MNYDFNTTVQTQPANCRHDSILTKNYTETDQQFIVATQLLRNIWIPTIVLIGFPGNTLSLIVFCMQRMRKSPSSIFLAGLALADNVFLIGQLISWLDGQWAEILTNDLPCQCVVFVTYVSSFLSTWFVVGFTCERFFAICFPLRKHMCSMFREKMAVLTLTLLAFVMYLFNFWTVTAKQYGSRRKCEIRYKYIDFLQIFTWIDSVITMVIPFITITIMNAMVLRKALASFGSRMKPRTTVTSHPLGQHSTVVRRLKVTLTGKLDSPRFRLTRTLLLVSTTFLALNLPSHTMRLYNLSISTVSRDKNYTTSFQLNFFQEMALMLYYTTFGCNFAIYTLFVRKFRDSLKTILTCCSGVNIRRRTKVHKIKTAKTLEKKTMHVAMGDQNITFRVLNHLEPDIIG